MLELIKANLGLILATAGAVVAAAGGILGSVCLVGLLLLRGGLLSAHHCLPELCPLNQ